MTTANSSSSPSDGEVGRVPLDRLRAHPANPNKMSAERLEKLARNIEEEGGRYPPLVVRASPDNAGDYQLLDGHQRVEALRQLGVDDAEVYVWQCDDETAELLLVTVNELKGESSPHRRTALLSRLAERRPLDELTEGDTLMGSPARAGIDPPRDKARQGSYRFPRTRGDRPVT